jgi:hypothetical protein
MEEKLKSFLDEGYDFIEESCSTEPLSYTDFNETVISEAQTVKSPFKIIGRLAGKFAPVGGFSRNNRYYPESHWKTVLESEEVQRRLRGREMLGMIGHEDSRVGDFQIRNGLISHVVGCLDIREDANGKPYLYGELDILDTPAGRILKAMHEGGAGLYVSSRGAGKLLDTPGKPYKTVSPQFFLETWDVVARPGFLEAKPVFEQVEREVPQPQLHESHEEISQPTTSSTSEELTTLKSQIDKLAKIVEKVVDDVYEEEPTSEAQEEPKQKVMAEKPAEPEHMQEQPIAPVDKKGANEALADFVSLMASTNISEDKFSEIIDLIAASKKGENK